ncbi:DsrE family protein [Celerinatantimonas diazotrophica]|uniref:Uncharacterized protein n=1 Tax=Celerinatantimonas diazotrophica TaxID=412034 RepID=A0A4R1K1C8_9GAMM|nr:DsrE family protein [Celerinatantimonas diazotrophica]TCK57788.1 hypothetical protein EV690_1484 [Celerinatantimonas diazotrophica]CAG9298148.1 hypothetical protein CEDIAZO_03343 [Celerinatantimonas diazotrophica]
MEMSTVQVIFHIDETNKWPMVLANVKNLLKVVDPQHSHIVVLANSQAVLAYTADSAEHQPVMASLAADGVCFEACQNSLTGLKIERDSLSEFVQVVGVGVLEIIEKQSAGYAYIRP